MTVCMEYPAKRPYEDEPENAAERGQESHAESAALQIWNYDDTKNWNQ